MTVGKKTKSKDKDIPRPEKEKSKKRKHEVVVHQNAGEAQGHKRDHPGGSWGEEVEQTLTEQHPAKKRRSEGAPKMAFTDEQPAAERTSTQKAPSRTNAPQDLQTEKPSAVFIPRQGRDWTVSMALPGSILSNAKKHDLKTLLVGRIARAAAVWCVDEIIVYDDDPTNIPINVDPKYRGKKKSKIEILDSVSEADMPYQDPDRFLTGMLEYCECPPHFRRQLFPECEPMRYVGSLPPFDMPHHQRSNEWGPYREGIALPDPCKPPQGKGKDQGWTYVACGLPYPVKVPHVVQPGMRVTLEFANPEAPRSWPNLSAQECDNIAVDGAVPSAPREQGGYYWGYVVRRAASLSAVYDETDLEGGYDCSIGTSERGVPLTSVLPDAIAPRNRPKSDNLTKFPDRFKHLLIVFGGVAGLEPAVASDPTFQKAGLTKNSAHEAFDFWVNLVQGQGSRTIRTEEAIEIGLAGLKGYIDYQYEN
ncbi:hypothetical protein N0V90_012986 [Kalmusia sp. IMI 367209]|nr:hypothetical protein N0V90_012986 [Kalmusia sp. IMI 367209]